jgi:hypothetical protein
VFLLTQVCRGRCADGCTVRRSRPTREGSANSRIACGVRKLPAFRSEHYAHRQQHNRANARGTECVPADNQHESMKSVTANIDRCAGRRLPRKGERVFVSRQSTYEADWSCIAQLVRIKFRRCCATQVNHVPLLRHARGTCTRCSRDGRCRRARPRCVRWPLSDANSSTLYGSRCSPSSSAPSARPPCVSMCLRSRHWTHFSTNARHAWVTACRSVLASKPLDSPGRVTITCHALRYLFGLYRLAHQ